MSPLFFTFLLIELCQTVAQQDVIEIDLSSGTSCDNQIKPSTDFYQINEECYRAEGSGCVQFPLEKKFQVTNVFITPDEPKTLKISLILSKSEKKQCERECEGPAKQIQMLWKAENFTICKMEVRVESRNKKTTQSLTDEVIIDVFSLKIFNLAGNTTTSETSTTTTTRHRSTTTDGETTVTTTGNVGVKLTQDKLKQDGKKVVKLSDFKRKFHIAFWVFPIMIVVLLAMFARKVAKRVNEIKNIKSDRIDSSNKKDDHKDFNRYFQEVIEIPSRKELKSTHEEPESRMEKNIPATKPMYELVQNKKSKKKIVEQQQKVTLKKKNEVVKKVGQEKQNLGLKKKAQTARPAKKKR